LDILAPPKRRADIIEEDAMPIWKGEIVSGELSMLAEVRYIMPTGLRLGEWEGRGSSATSWPLVGEEVETDAGTILIIESDQTPWRNGLYRIEFRGSGNPRGELAKKMGF
jgi:hypothetical protein